MDNISVPKNMIVISRHNVDSITSHILHELINHYGTTDPENYFSKALY